MYLFISIFSLKFDELQDKLQNFEETSISSANIGNIFNSVREILNMKNFTYYDPKLSLFKDYQDRTSAYEYMALSGMLSFSDAMYVLNFYISIDWMRDWCEEAKARLYLQLPDVDQFFNTQKVHYFDAYQYELDELNTLASNITNNDTAEQIREKIGNNNSYFIINNLQQLNQGVPFTNPMIYSRFSKDIVYIFDDFEEIDILNTTILETSSLVDRVWIFIIINNKQVNIFEKLYNEKYLSLLQAIILQYPIIEFIKKNIKYENQVNDFQFIREIQSEIEAQNIGQNYRIKNGTNIIEYTSYFVFIIFTKHCNYLQPDLKSSLNRIIIMVSKEQCNYFMQRFNQHIQLFLSYSNETQYRNSSLKSIIQYLNQLFYDETPKFGNVNKTIVFIKPVYVDSVYVGSIFKTVDYTQYLSFSMFGVDMVSRTTILDTKTKRTLIDLFAQYSSVVMNTNGNIDAYYTYQPLVFNQLDINTNHSDYIQVTKQQVFNIIDNEIFMITQSTKYQKQFKSRKHISVSTLSSTFLGQLLRLPYQFCNTQDKLYIDQLELFHNYVSSSHYNLTALRSISSPSHLSSSQICNNIQGCVNESSKFLNYQSLMKQTFHPNKQINRCQISKQKKFNLHSYEEIIIKQYKNLKHSGNISYFMSQIEQFLYLISIDKAYEGFQLPLISFVVSNSYFSTEIIDDYRFIYQIQKVVDNKMVNVMFDEIVSDDTIIVIPLIIFDIWYGLNDISMFTAMTNNLKNIITQQDVSEVVLSNLNVDNSVQSYRSLFDNEYDQYLANEYHSKSQEVQKLILERINLYKQNMEVYQLHHFSFSTGDNWELIMREQLKAQPTALTEKFRVGQINGKLSVTKALTVQSKTIDNQTTVGGFLTVVLNQPYQFPVDEPYTLFDLNMRYIAGVENSQYQNGVKQILFKQKYIKNIFVNYTYGNIQNILEFDSSFWINAFKLSQEKEYTIIITQNKSTYQNRISESDYNKSEIHQRSVIFNASCDYFLSGQIIVKQLGAIDGLLIIYKNLVISNYTKDFKVVIQPSVDGIMYYYGNLNSRQQSTTYSTNYVFNNTNIIKLNLSIQETVTIMYQICIPLLLLIIILVLKFKISKPSFDFYYSEDQKMEDQKILSYLSSESKTCNHRRIRNNINYIQSVNSELFYNIEFVESSSRLQLTTGLIFQDDLSKYQFLQNRATHEYIYEYLLKQTEVKEQSNMFSFQILVTSQQYSVIMNGILRSKSWISNKFILLTGSLQVRYNSCHDANVLKARNSRHTSRQPSKLASRIMSSNNLLQTIQEPNVKRQGQDLEVYVQKVFDDSNMYIDRKLSSPCKVSIFKFSTIIINTQLDDLLEQSKFK
ncbi:Conserved_hypothetical protein [Hexamita inflata]|uniref:Transmembrane protein n=2 Tax=Hexamita inflata TaxID=28002 RepID=A0AA86NJP6_9EUKA|nr:Conserved hypothetical protein [Hexamita inflata]